MEAAGDSSINNVSTALSGQDDDGRQHVQQAPETAIERTQAPATCAAPPYFRLPPELRQQILGFVIPVPEGGVHLGRCGMGIPRAVKDLFLVCRQMYADAVPVYYRDVRIDLQGYGFASPALRCVNRFLRTAETPRRHVRHATVLINLIDCCNCESVGRLALAQYCGTGGVEGAQGAGDGVSSSSSSGGGGDGGLRRVDVCIGPDYPYPPYGCYLHPPKRPVYRFRSRLDSGAQATGPICVTQSPFQMFLDFLQQPGFGTVAVWLHRYHLEFLCPFHAPHPTGRECKGEWRGGPGDWIPLDHEAMIRAFAGTQVDRSVEPPRALLLPSLPRPELHQ